MVPRYTDVSHFRAPYKNTYLGQLGAEAVPIPVPAPSPEAAVTNVEADGTKVLKAEVVKAIYPRLGTQSVIFLSDTDVKLRDVVQGDPAESALAWINRKLGEGKSVLIGSTAGILGAVAPVAGVDLLLKAASNHAEEKAATDSNLYAVLARPDSGGVIGGSKSGLVGKLGGPIGVAVIALALAGGTYYVMKRRKKAR